MGNVTRGKQPAIRLPKHLAAELPAHGRFAVDLTVEAGRLEADPAKKYDLGELVAGISPATCTAKRTGAIPSGKKRSDGFATGPSRARRPAPKYVPDRGHLVWLEFTPQAGREQAGHRPALVLSPKAYNAKTSPRRRRAHHLRRQGLPVEALVPAGAKVGGAVLCDHVRSVDYVQRKAALIEPARPHSSPK